MVFEISWNCWEKFMWGSKDKCHEAIVRLVGWITNVTMLGRHQIWAINQPANVPHVITPPIVVQSISPFISGFPTKYMNPVYARGWCQNLLVTFQIQLQSSITHDSIQMPSLTKRPKPYPEVTKVGFRCNPVSNVNPHYANITIMKTDRILNPNTFADIKRSRRRIWNHDFW